MMDTSAFNPDSNLNMLWGFCEATIAMKHKGPEWKRLKMFCESTLGSIKSGQFNEADTDDLLTNFVSLNDLWGNSLAFMVEHADSACLARHLEFTDPGWLAQHPEITEEY